MTKSSSRHLRIHWEPSTMEDLIDAEDLATPEELAELFSAATGWQVRLEPLSSDEDAPALSSDQDSPNQILTGTAGVRWDLVPPSADEEIAALAAPAVLQLAQQLTGYHEKLERAYQSLREREAELATAIPLSVLDDEGVHLAERLEWVLQAGAEALDCSAAALYLLDDTTQTLKLRVSWGLPRHRLVDPPRALRGAVADLEALMGSAVVLEDVRLAPFWRTPESFPSALCLPVSTPHTPLGTIWFFSKETRGFSDAQVQLAEVISGRIVADLERETLRHEVQRNRDYARQVRDALVWQQERQPDGLLPIDDWTLAGYRNPSGWVGGGFFDWIVLPDSRILLVAANLLDDGVVASLGSAFLRGALWSHAATARDPADLLQRMHETLWTASPGGDQSSLFAAMIEPESGRWQYAAAGEWYMWFGARQAEVEYVHHDFLGDQLDSVWEKRTGPAWKRGKRLIVATADSLTEDDWSQITDSLRHTKPKRTSANSTLELIRENWEPGNEPPRTDQVFVVAQRHR